MNRLLSFLFAAVLIVSAASAYSVRELSTSATGVISVDGINTEYTTSDIWDSGAYPHTDYAVRTSDRKVAIFFAVNASETANYTERYFDFDADNTADLKIVYDNSTGNPHTLIQCNQNYSGYINITSDADCNNIRVEYDNTSTTMEVLVYDSVLTASNESGFPDTGNYPVVLYGLTGVSQKLLTQIDITIDGSPFEYNSSKDLGGADFAGKDYAADDKNKHVVWYFENNETGRLERYVDLNRNTTADLRFVADRSTGELLVQCRNYSLPQWDSSAFYSITSGEGCNGYTIEYAKNSTNYAIEASVSGEPFISDNIGLTKARRPLAGSITGCIGSAPRNGSIWSVTVPTVCTNSDINVTSISVLSNLTITDSKVYVSTPKTGLSLAYMSDTQYTGYLLLFNNTKVFLNGSSVFLDYRTSYILPELWMINSTFDGYSSFEIMNLTGYGCRIENNTFQNVGETDLSYLQGCVIKGNTWNNTTDAALAVRYYSKDLEITGNTFYNISGGTDTCLRLKMDGNPALQGKNMTNVTVTGNTFNTASLGIIVDGYTPGQDGGTTLSEMSTANTFSNMGFGNVLQRFLVDVRVYSMDGYPINGANVHAYADNYPGYDFINDQTGASWVNGSITDSSYNEPDFETAPYIGYVPNAFPLGNINITVDYVFRETNYTNYTYPVDMSYNHIGDNLINFTLGFNMHVNYYKNLTEKNTTCDSSSSEYSVDDEIGAEAGWSSYTRAAKENNKIAVYFVGNSGDSYRYLDFDNDNNPEMYLNNINGTLVGVYCRSGVEWADKTTDNIFMCGGVLVESNASISGVEAIVHDPYISVSNESSMYKRYILNGTSASASAVFYLNFANHLASINPDDGAPSEYSSVNDVDLENVFESGEVYATMSCISTSSMCSSGLQLVIHANTTDPVLISLSNLTADTGDYLLLYNSNAYFTQSFRDVLCTPSRTGPSSTGCLQVEGGTSLWKSVPDCNHSDAQNQWYDGIFVCHNSSSSEVVLTGLSEDEQVVVSDGMNPAKHIVLESDFIPDHAVTFSTVSVSNISETGAQFSFNTSIPSWGCVYVTSGYSGGYFCDNTSYWSNNHEVSVSGLTTGRTYTYYAQSRYLVPACMGEVEGYGYPTTSGGVTYVALSNSSQRTFSTAVSAFKDNFSITITPPSGDLIYGTNARVYTGFDSAYNDGLETSPGIAVFLRGRDFYNKTFPLYNITYTYNYTAGKLYVDIGINRSSGGEYDILLYHNASAEAVQNSTNQSYVKYWNGTAWTLPSEYNPNNGAVTFSVDGYAAEALVNDSSGVELFIKNASRVRLNLYSYQVSPTVTWMNMGTRYLKNGTKRDFGILRDLGTNFTTTMHNFALPVTFQMDARALEYNTTAQQPSYTLAYGPFYVDTPGTYSFYYQRGISPTLLSALNPPVEGVYWLMNLTSYPAGASGATWVNIGTNPTVQSTWMQDYYYYTNTTVLNASTLQILHYNGSAWTNITGNVDGDIVFSNITNFSVILTGGSIISSNTTVTYNPPSSGTSVTAVVSAPGYEITLTLALFTAAVLFVTVTNINRRRG